MEYNYRDYFKYRGKEYFSVIENLMENMISEEKAREEFEQIDQNKLKNHIAKTISSSSLEPGSKSSKRSLERKRLRIKQKYPKANRKVATLEMENAIYDSFYAIPGELRNVYFKKFGSEDERLMCLAEAYLNHIVSMRYHIDKLIFITDIELNHRKYLEAFYDYKALLHSTKEKHRESLSELFHVYDEYISFVKRFAKNKVIQKIEESDEVYCFNREYIDSEGLKEPRSATCIAYLLFKKGYLNTSNKAVLTSALNQFFNLDFKPDALRKSWKYFENENSRERVRYISAFEHILSSST